jgi:hypothetical protein
MANTNYLVLVQQSTTGIAVEAPIPETFAMDLSATYEQALPQGFVGNKAINLTAAAFGARLSVQALSAQLWSGNNEMDLSIDLEFHTENDPVNDVRAPILNLMKLTTPTISSTTGMLASPGPSLDFSAVANALGTGAGQLVNIGKSVQGAAANPSSLVNAIGNAASSAWSSIRAGYQSATTGLIDPSQQTADGSNNVQQALQQNPSLGSAAYWKTQVKNSISIAIGNYLYFDSVVITRVSNTFMSNFDAQTGLPHNVRVQVAFKPLFMIVASDLDQMFLNPKGGATPGNNSFGFSLPAPTGANSGSFGIGANTFGFHT